ncbi:CynX/NimT family MFS transporter [Actinomycetospora cinnamomea]|uniref:CP family cyanate transporter-like MFS transporter n=1 Tax=Actinomycetospora cinnamomea TaxID=663609 RepID=A0A2U1FQ45_9PSEU|nr:MFS transporter [Actinomycetospora cinnamomea]PVZ14313.1 CP family cyanate transporter-like MFS transporter [Actinomycetospora cinnamomea]
MSAPASSAPAAVRPGGALAAFAVLLLAANLRPPVVGVAPLVDQAQADLGISSGVAGLLTSLPVLCFGLLAPVAPRLARRWGLERLLVTAMLVLAAGIALRLVDVLAVILAGSVLVGTAIAVGNVSLPTLVKRDFPHRTGAMTGAYSMVLTGGGALAAAVTVPLQRVTGLDWRLTLGLWGLLTLVTLVVWVPRARRRTVPPEPPGEGAAMRRAMVRDPLAWQVTLFMGLQSLQFYATSAWIPTIYVDAGRSPAEAGLLLSLAGVVGLVFSATMPSLAMRRRSQSGLITVLCAFYVAGYAGLILAPATVPALWMVLVGVAQGSMIAMGLLLITLRSPDTAHTAELSAMAQGVGYTLAAVGPSGLGALHDLTGGWTVPLLVMTVLVVPTVLMGIGAGRDRHVLS